MGQQGTKVHLQLPTNVTDMLVTTEPKVTIRVYAFSSTFKTTIELK